MVKSEVLCHVEFQKLNMFDQKFWINSANSGNMNIIQRLVLLDVPSFSCGSTFGKILSLLGQI